jgi:hypothetical protein
MLLKKLIVRDRTRFVPKMNVSKEDAPTISSTKHLANLLLYRNRYERQNGINQCTSSGVVAFCTAEFRETKSIVSYEYGNSGKVPTDVSGQRPGCTF